MESQIHYQFADLEHLLSNKSATELQFDSELLKIKRTFAVPMFEMADEVQVRHYIRFHQYALVRLMDRINAGHRQKRRNMVSFRRLEEVLHFLASDFKDFYDFDAKAPDDHIQAARRHAKRHLARLRERLARKTADVALIEVALHGLSQIEKQHGNFSVTFRRILFAEQVQRVLYDLVGNEQTNIEEQLHTMLFYLNCNSIRVFLYETQLFERQLASVSGTEKLEQLALALKKVNQIQVKPGVGYNVHGTPLKELVSSYLNEEISYLERLNASIIANRAVDKALENFKLKVNLSVSQVAYVFRIFVENQFILTQNQTELLKFLAKVVVTKKAEHVSFDSLRAKYYNIEMGTKESVKGVLASLVRYVERN